MTLEQFTFLDKNSQEEYLKNAGSLIGTWEQGQLECDLYQCENFFVEVHYNSKDGVKFIIRSFASSKDLKPFNTASGGKDN